MSISFQIAQYWYQSGVTRSLCGQYSELASALRALSNLLEKKDLLQDPGRYTSIVT